MTAKNKNKDSYDELFQSISQIAEATQQLAGQAVMLYTPIVENIIKSKTTDSNQIEHTLDHILDFCFNDQMLLLFKKLCRFLYFIDQEGAFFYVNAYREMWDNEDEQNKPEQP